MNIRLIVNSDDYGRTPAVARGIRTAHLNGIVTSTTAMVNMPAIVTDLRLAQQETPALGIGVHLVLTSGRPVLPVEQVPSLVTAEGAFRGYDAFFAEIAQIDPAQAMAEWKAQVERFVAITGRAPTHLDSHHHTSYSTPELLRGMLELAHQYQCAIRPPVVSAMPDDQQAPEPADGKALYQKGFAASLLAEFQPRRPDYFYVNFYDEHATESQLLHIIEHLQPGVSEIMCHPGYNDADLNSTYAQQREGELAVLTSPAVKAALAARQVELISFAAL